MKTHFAMLVASSVILCGCSGEPQNLEGEYKQRFGKTWPDADDLAWFRKAEGMTEPEVLATYGYPTEKTQMEGARVRWRYPWLAAAHIDFQDGIAISVFYTAGY